MPNAKRKKAMTGAERQAAYRARRKGARLELQPEEGTDQRELKAWIATNAFLKLGRLARHYGVSKRDMLERLISDGQKKTLAGIKDTPAEDAYWKTL
jgi:hypothetical protein